MCNATALRILTKAPTYINISAISQLLCTTPANKWYSTLIEKNYENAVVNSIAGKVSKRNLTLFYRFLAKSPLTKFISESTYFLNSFNAEAPASKALGHKDFLKSSKPCHVGIHWIALAEYSEISTHMPGFQSFFRVFESFCIGQISHQKHKG